MVDISWQLYGNNGKMRAIKAFETKKAFVLHADLIRQMMEDEQFMFVNEHGIIEDVTESYYSVCLINIIEGVYVVRMEASDKVPLGHLKF